MFLYHIVKVGVNLIFWIAY